MADDIPEWAIERASKLTDLSATASGYKGYWQYHQAFARYIAEHEEPPADPIAEAWDAALGAYNSTHVGLGQPRLAGLKRLREELAKIGIEIAESGK